MISWLYKNKRAIIFYIIFFLFILSLNSMVNGFDYDLWARLIAGKAFIQTGHVLKYDFLSYTPTHIWYDHEWGSSVIFYLIQHFFGGAGLLILQSILIFFIFFTITKIVELRGLKTTHAYNFLFYFFTISAINYLIYSPIRCQLFSFLFFTIFLYILERTRKWISNDKELIILTPLLMIIWNNLHGGCVAGIGLIVIYIIGELLNRAPLKKIYTYIYSLIFTILVMPIHPLGFKYLIYLYKANTMARTYVMEWWGIFFPYNIHQYINFKILAAVLILAEAIFILMNLIENKKQESSKLTLYNFDKTKYLLLLTTLILAIQHAKLIPLFTICAACFLYDDFYTVFNSLTKNIFNKFSTIKDIIVYSIILIFIATNLNYNTFKPKLTWNQYPTRAIEFIKLNNIKGNLLINFGFGSYASYKLYPQNKIFIDGRYEEVYYDYMIPMLQKFYLVNAGWDEVLKKFPPDIIVIEKYYPIYKTLLARKHWVLVFEDSNYGVFIKEKNVRKNYKQPSNDINYYKKHLFDTNINFVLKSRDEQ